jgi:cell division protein FtsL
MRALGFFDRRVRGFRIVELGAMAVLAALVVVVYLAKDGAGDKRADIDRVQQEILAEQDQVRLLKAEVAHQEQPERIEALAGQYLGLQPVAAKHEVDAGALADLARVSAPAPVAGVGSSAAGSSSISVTPGLVPGAGEHEQGAASTGATTSPSAIPGPRDKPGGDEVGKVAILANSTRHRSSAPPAAASAH